MIQDPQQALTAAFGDVIENFEEAYGDLIVVIPAEKLIEVCQFLRDEKGLVYDFLSVITAVDYYPEEPRFGLRYYLYSLRHNRNISLKVMWSDGDPDVPSLCGLWPGANWKEREVFDMFGIPFANHPDLRRILMPADWDGHPLRRDYPLGYETVQFSFNFEEVNRHKPYAKK